MRQGFGRFVGHVGPVGHVGNVGPVGLAGLLALAVLGSCQPPRDAPVDPPAVKPWLVDVAAAAGLDFVHVRGAAPRFLFPEIMGGGAAWLDYDLDGDLDIYFVQSGEIEGGGPGNVLYRNRGDGTFENTTDEAGVGDRGYGMGVAVGDYDGDGDPDLFVTNYGPDVLYENRGDGTFADVTAAAGVGDPGWSVSAAFLDYDGDGDLDLFVVRYVRWSPDREIDCFTGAGQRDYCGPLKYNAPAPDELYENRGDGTFRAVGAEAGLGTAFGYGLGLAYGDFDLDGRLDVFVANDAVPNQLWMARGGMASGNGRFHDEALLAGCAVNVLGAAEASMGAVAFDLESDGDLDLFVTHLREETNTLFLNQGGTFADATVLEGLAAPSLPWTGFGAGFADFDHDGVLDLFVANGKVRDPDFMAAGDPYAEPNQVFTGAGDAAGRVRFAEHRSALAPGTYIGSSRAAAFADYDDDGDVDVAVVNNGGRAELLQNQSDKKGQWIQFRVLDRHGADAAGDRVAVTFGGRTLWRPTGTASSYCSSHDPRVHFGLPASSEGDAATGVDDVAVVWPGNHRESFGPRAAGRVHLLREGRGTTP